ncbi:zinc ribbon domain-containing protein [Nocardioides sp. 1609]|uniref:NADase-type glycan-binding domain-containing protein n=1 Tax=Nocardioides sp. 1609 TaxID=2508327 RepID=UPI00107026C5|nr:zinc ribbon domain-containing protein [Nocardioides sp. 1609]
MDECPHCGHTLGTGRFCVSCGHPREEAGTPPEAWRTDTAERPAVRPAGPLRPPPAAPPVLPPAAPPVLPPVSPPVSPLPAWERPPEPRYPLFADEAPRVAPPSTGGDDQDRDDEPAGSVLPYADDEAAAWAVAPEDTTGRARRGLLPWLVAAAALLLVAALGGYLLLTGDADDDSADDPAPTAPAAGTDPSSPSGSASPDPATSPPPEPSAPPTTRSGPNAGGKPRDVAAAASATAPQTARPSRDVGGAVVRYGAGNLLDGRTDTAWRMPGDGTGTTLSISLAEATRLTKIGLVNGYAKKVTGYDGYTANRRVTSVEWVFADGTVVPQSLVEGRGLQSIPVDVVSDTVELRILGVTRPGRGPSGRDYTAISEIGLVGVPL